jgi:hypothetical protein
MEKNEIYFFLPGTPKSNNKMLVNHQQPANGNVERRKEKKIERIFLLGAFVSFSLGALAMWNFFGNYSLLETICLMPTNTRSLAELLSRKFIHNINVRPHFMQNEHCC